MKTYRIGKVQEPWTNLVPPIRSNVYAEKKKNADSDEKRHDTSDSLIPRVDSLEAIDVEQAIVIDQYKSKHKYQESRDYCDSEKCTGASLHDEGQLPLQQSKLKTTDVSTMSRAQYTAMLEQDEIDQGIRDLPSLDVDTQRAITLEYRAMHEQIKKQGLYNCRYSEYYKEMVRYSLLLLIFILFLRAEWYLTSACFLGMFWVSSFLFRRHHSQVLPHVHPHVHPRIQLHCRPHPHCLRIRLRTRRTLGSGNQLTLLSSSKSCFPHMTLDTVELPAILSSTP